MAPDEIQKLEGVELDLAVAKSAGIESYISAWGGVRIVDTKIHQWPIPYYPSRGWLQGGEIIEEHRIELRPGMVSTEWLAMISGKVGFVRGSTPLEAAMRAFVMSKQ